MGDHLNIPTLPDMRRLAWDATDQAVPVLHETIPTPSRTPAERYLRPILPDLHRQRADFIRANYHDDHLKVLLPGGRLSAELAADLHGGRVLGIPIEVVPGMEAGPLLAVDLKLTHY